MKSLSAFESFLGKFSEVRIIKSIKQGLLCITPLIMVGSVSLILLNLLLYIPEDQLPSIFGTTSKSIFLPMYKATFSIISLSSMLSISYAVTQDSIKAYDNYSTINVTLTSLACYVVLQYDSDITIDSTFISINGMFYAILIGTVSAKLYILIYYKLPKKKRIFTYDEDSLLQSSLSNVLPALFTVMIFSVIRVLLHFFEFNDHMNNMINVLYHALSQQGSGFLAFLIFLLIAHLLYFFGIHGTAIVEGVLTDVFTSAGTINSTLKMTGQNPTEILTEEFFSVFVIMGGTGCTLGLLLALLISSRSRNSRQLVRFALFPGIFNINEVVIYGLPIVFNPFLLIPFLTIPVILSISSYLIISFGWVPIISNEVAFVTPIFLSGYLSTGSIAGVFLQLFNLSLSTLIYYPFVRLFEKNDIKNYQKQLGEVTRAYASAVPEKPPCLLARKDQVGSISRELASGIKEQINGKDMGLYMEYQPKTKIDGAVYGAEALLRWHHPTLEYISPITIIGIAGEAEMSVELGAWIIEQSLLQLSKWHETGLNLTLSINLTPQQIKDDTKLIERIKSISEKYHINMEYVEFEITEQGAVDQGFSTRQKLKQLKELGAHIAIDDFGAGSSSLMYLHDFNADVVKLDMSLTRALTDNSKTKEFVQSIISLCNELHASVIAEGVETLEQVEILVSLGCNQFQGWYFSKSLSPDEFSKYIDQHGMAMTS